MDIGGTVDQYPVIRYQMMCNFIWTYLPMAQLGSNTTRSWLMMLPELPDLTVALETAMMAVSAAKLGRDQSDSALVKVSLGLYTRGLRELQRALYDPALMYRDETLGACMALATYEAMECPSDGRRAFVSHQKGCSRLVELRGPEAHSQGLGHFIFLFFRLLRVLEALKEHQPTYLSSHAWRTLPWSAQPKSPFDQIFDYFTQAPELSKEADCLGKVDLWTSLRKTHQLIDRCLRLEKGVEAFYMGLESSVAPNSIYWSKHSTLHNVVDNAEGEKMFPEAYQFSNLRMAHTMMFYWATLLMLWSGLCQLYKHVYNLKLRGVSLDNHDTHDGNNTTSPNHSDHHHSNPVDLSSPKKKGTTTEPQNFVAASILQPSPRLPPLAHRADFASMAWNICKSVEYCMQDEMLQSGHQSVAAPLQIAIETLRAYPGYEREVRWAEEVLRKVSEEEGLRILKYVDT